MVRKRVQKKGGDIMTIMKVLLTKQIARVIIMMTGLMRKMKVNSQLLKRKRTKKKCEKTTTTGKKTKEETKKVSWTT